MLEVFLYLKRPPAPATNKSFLYCTIELIKRGHSVYIPHFTHYMHLRPNCPFEYEEYLKNDLEWLKVSDAVFFLSHSNGADGELRVAKKLGLRIYTDITEVGYRWK